MSDHYDSIMESEVKPLSDEDLKLMEKWKKKFKRELPLVPFSYTTTKIKLHAIHFCLMDMAMTTRVFFYSTLTRSSLDVQLISPEWARIFFTLRRTDLQDFTLPQHHLINILKGLDVSIWERRRELLKEELVESMCKDHRKKLTLLYIYKAIKPTSRENRYLLQRETPPDFKMPNIIRGFVKSRRRALSEKLLINTIQMRFALWQANAVLPHYVLDLLQLRDKEYRALGRVRGRVEELITKFDRIASSQWYQKIIDMVVGKQAPISALPVSQQKPLVSLLNQFIKEQVVCIKERTIERALNIVGSVRTSPLVDLRLAYFGKEKISLIPSYSRVIQNYIHLIARLNRAGVMLPKLEYHVMKEKLLFIRTEGTPGFISNVIKRVIPVAVSLLAPIMKHIRHLENEFNSLICVESLLEYEQFRSQKQPMELLCEKLVFFKNIYKKIIALSKFEYIGNFRLNQSELIGTLSHLCQRIVTDLILELSLSHVSEIVEFSVTMLDLNKLAMMVPRTTKELIDLGKYMNYARAKLMEQYKAKLKRLISIAIIIIEHHEMLTDHMDLLSHAVYLYRKGNSIFESFSSMFEATKFELEDRMHSTSEVLSKFVTDFIGIFDVYEGITNVMNIHENIKIGTRLANAVDAFYPIIEWINGEEVLFQMPMSTYPEVEEYKQTTYGMLKLFWLVSKWFRTEKLWMYGDFTDLDAEDVEDVLEIFQKTFLQLQKNYKSKMKQQITDDDPKRFKGFLDDPDYDLWPTPLKLIHTALQSIKAFRVYLPLIQILSNNAMTARHWAEMSELVGFDITPQCGTSLSNYLTYKLESLLDSFEIISIGATKEKELKENLEKMMAEWETLCFTVSPFKDTGLPILTGVDDVQAVLDDHIVKTLSMRGSAFVKPVQDIVNEWYGLLVLINNSIEAWGKVQIDWLYLLPIFSSKDIVAQMPEEGALFQEVDSAYRSLMKQVEKDPNVKNSAGHPGLLPILQHCQENLELVYAGVNRYLESKRLFFPRFFFLSNEEMLEILSETKDPLRVQPHLKKCFEGIEKLEFDPDLNITAMWSAEGEKVDMFFVISTVEARGSVEKWLLQVEEDMVLSVKDVIIKSLKDYSIRGRSVWVVSWPGQVVLCVSMSTWTALMEDVLSRNDYRLVGIFHKGLTNQLNDLIELVRGRLSKQSRITLCALVVLDVHAKDVTYDLFEKKIDTSYDFEWQAQLRYYVYDDVYVKIIYSSVNYAYEYLGNTPRLVITPLTDRCYRTLIGAYHLHLNGAPEGPAGTGKTETTKDLAKALAIQCVVFNCSDGLDYLAMAKFFKGLAATGAWVCFDEFNRIDVEVLSVIAQQILSIVQAVRNKLEEFMFEGSMIKLNPRCYVCITMNPGYAGRSELPDNLKVLFRTMAMMVPDYAMIGEISLYSYGFISARPLSVKIVSVYRLCSEQLSSQSHYDYGMRAVKSVLTAAGNLKQKFPKDLEDILLLRSIIDVNLPKFLNYDVPLFEGIVSDLFPNVVLPKPDYELINQAIYKICQIYNLQPVESFMIKIIQTYEMMIVRHGFMMVGEPFSGKTCVLHVLADVLNEMKKEHDLEEYCQYATMNPKAVTMGQLYGQYDLISHDWYDGILAKIYRGFAVDPSTDRKWVIFDGPVDAVWIENMNSVLDDNKKLCLNSGEVIQMTQNMSIIFEVMDLIQASPATVSRCGMIYMEPQTLGWRVHVECWFTTIPTEWLPDNPESILEMFDWILPPCMLFIQRHCKTLTNGGYLNPVWTTIKLIHALMKRALEETPDTKYTNTWWFAAFVVSIVWGLAGTLDTKSRESFDSFLKSLWKGDVEGSEEVVAGSQEIALPTEGNLHDYFYVFKAKGQWKYWPEYLKSLKPDEAATSNQFYMVPTVETTKYMYMMELCMSNRMPFLMTGPTGTGKSFYIQNKMMMLNTDIFVPAFITFTTSTSANMLQELVTSKVHKLRRGIYGAVKEKFCIIFIDDCNLPSKDVYGSIPAIELIRQYFDHGNWFDLKDMTKLLLVRTMFIAAMGLPGGSRQEIYQRFLRHFHLFSINAFSDDSMSKIFSNLLFFGWRRNGFPTDVMPICTSVVSATNWIFQEATINLLPTPMKSHYLFNLRDFARVITGMLLLRKETAENKRTYVRLWVHEILRVFYDRLIDIEDRSWLFSAIKESVKTIFKETFDIVMDKLEPNPDTKVVSEEALRNLMFTSAFDAESDEGRKYEEVPTLESFKEVAVNCISDYNATHKNKMSIVLFRYALEHLSRVLRVLSMPCGSALLVGVGGSGRQSITRLAASILLQVIMQPEITKNYAFNEWRNDLKKVLKESGGRNKHVTFLMNESQIKEDYFLQDIDALLNSGEVPNIFPIDEQQEIIEMVRLAAQGGNRNVEVSSQQVIFHFIQRCKINLHIVLCLSPVGSALRTRLRLYPSLVNCCTIDWFEGWPEDALEMVAKEYLNSVSVSDAVKESAVHLCKYFHVSTRETGNEFYTRLRRKIYVTSASYLDLIKSYSELIKFKQQETINMKMRYINGLNKLEFAGEQVAIMKQELEALQPQLKAAAVETQAMLSIIEKETVQVEKASELVKNDEIVANKQAEEANKLKIECENDLALAIPILEDALAALNILKPADITLVKSMKNPPDPVKLVMAAVCVMKDIKPEKIPDPNNPGRKIMDYWGPSKKLLGDMQFLQSLKEYNKDRIPPAVMQQIRKVYLPNKDFRPEVVAKASSAAEGLCKWVIAMDKYDVVIKEVEPKKQKLEQAEKEFSDTMALLNSKREQLRILEEKLNNLNEQLKEALEKKKKLQDDVRSCSSKLEKAEKIINSLGGEKTRWNQASEDLQKDYECLPGDMLISSGIIAYLSPFTSFYRTKLIEEWTQLCRKHKIPMSATYDLIKILGSDIKIQTWNIHGLPRDSFSIENSVILEWSKRFSLLIDPQGQANKWIKQMEREAGIKVIKLSDDGYMKKIEIGLEYGNPVLIESILEDLDPPLDPILLKQTFTQGGKKFITLGENVMEYNPNFRLYLTTKLANPHYLPEIFNKVTIINFAITLEGLADQLLGIVVAKDRPDLQEKREVLTVQGAANRRALKEVEDKILETLSSVKGNILEDETAVNILDSSKSLSKDIKAKEEVAKETKLMIETFRLKYKPVAVHCAGLYYTITDLPAVDPMYVYSLPWFITIFTHSVDNSRKSKDIDERIFYISEFFNYSMYRNVCRSLFDKDKLLYSLILCCILLMNKGIVSAEEFDFLLTGGVGINESLVPQNPSNGWLDHKKWVDIYALDTSMKPFQGLMKSFSSHLGTWEEYCESSSASFDELPDGWSNKLTSFQTIVLINVIRPDMLLKGMVWLVTKELGTKFIEPPMFDMMGCYHDSTLQTPIIFILSAGMDPMQSLLLFAAKMDMADHFFYISLGQGQGERAKQMIETGQKQGNWICLQNCHLAASWMQSLESIVESIDPSETHNDFRLWLTSYPSPHFPTSLLQSGVKLTNEPPTGLKENILRCYSADPVNDPLFYYSCGETKNATFARMLFGITFFHTVVLERKKFGSIGWNVSYGFNDSDYLISIQQIQMYMIEREKSALKAVSYLSGECNYGGRVTDVWDRRCLTALLSGCICQELLDNKAFSMVPGDNNFVLPLRTSFKDFLKYIEKLPSTPEPEVFGLHSNAGIRRNFNETRTFLNSLVAMKGEGMAAKGSQQDEIVIQLAKDMLSKLPNVFDIDIVSEKYPTEYRESMNTVLVQEMQRYNKLLSVIRRSLSDIQKAVKGLMVMTPDLEALYTSLLIGRIPAAWAKASYPSLKPLASYVQDFIQRLTYIQTWYEQGKPKWFWLSGFYFTQAFLTGAMQNFARKYTIPIDTLTFDFEIISAPEGTSPVDGVYVYGLFLEGTRWNSQKHCLDEQKPKILSEDLPLLWIKPIKKDKLRERNRYISPLYKTSERKGVLSTTGHSTNYVLPILLETEKPPVHWVRRGAALLCQLDT